MNVFVVTMLLNGWTLNASPYVTTPSPSPAADDANVRSARTPPGFIRAMSASPRSASSVSASCASAIRLPSGFSTPSGAGASG